MNAFIKTFALFLLITAAAALPGRAQAAVDAAPAPPTNTVSEAEAQMLRSFLMLQDQLRTTQRAVEDARDEAQAEAKRTAELMSARLNLIEQTLNAQREQELQNLQRSTHTMIVIVGITTAVGFIAVLIAGFMQARAAMRLTEVSRQLAALPAPRFAELTAGTGASAALSGESVEAANASLLGAIDRLEHRLEEMETTTGGTHTATNGHKQIAPSGGSSTSQLATVLSKGQTLLNLDKPEEALNEFEEALRLEPHSIEAWIKRGTALERLQRIDEAITSYDQAIAIDGSTATAYLFKAGVYNRQKKYAEALQCYEKALNAQQKSRASQAPAQTV